MTGQWQSGHPAVSAKLEAAAELHAELTRQAAVGAAESTVRSARIAELHEAHMAAERRVSAARGRLTRARRDGSAAKIAAASARLRELEAEADRTGDTAIREMQALTGAGLASLGEYLDTMGRAWAADEVTDRVQSEL